MYQSDVYAPTSTMVRNFKSQNWPIPCTRNIKWSTFSGSPSSISKSSKPPLFTILGFNGEACETEFVKLTWIVFTKIAYFEYDDEKMIKSTAGESFVHRIQKLPMRCTTIRLRLTKYAKTMTVKIQCFSLFDFHGGKISTKWRDVFVLLFHLFNTISYIRPLSTRVVCPLATHIVRFT